MGRTPRGQPGRCPRRESAGQRASGQHLGPRGRPTGGPHPGLAVFLSVGLRRGWRKNNVSTFRKNIKDRSCAIWSAHGGLRMPDLPEHVSQDFLPSLFVHPRSALTPGFSCFLPQWEGATGSRGGCEAIHDLSGCDAHPGRGWGTAEP